MTVHTRIVQFLDYLRVEKKYSANTVVSYETDLTGMADYCASGYDVNDLSQITHIHIRSWIVSLVSAGVSAVSVNRKISALRSFYKWLNKRSYMAKNPMLKITAPKMPKRLPVTIQNMNMEKLLEQPIQTTSDSLTNYILIRDTFILVLLYSTGIRRAELIGLKISDFDLYRKEVRVTGKGNKIRSIPLTDTLISQMKDYLKSRSHWGDKSNDVLLLTNTGKPVYPRFIHDIVSRQLGELTTLSKKSPHVLRHTFATHMLDRGADLNGIKEILGHASLAATQVYTHSSIQKLKDVYSKAHPGAQTKK